MNYIKRDKIYLTQEMNLVALLKNSLNETYIIVLRDVL